MNLWILYKTQITLFPIRNLDFKLYIFAFLLLSCPVSGQNDSDILPLAGGNCQKVAEFYGIDSLFLNPVLLCTDNAGKYLYTSRIRTSVCQDNLCRNIYLEVNWDLAGNYLSFDTIQDYPLTKNDHIPFNGEDYIKLNNTLSDYYSVLGEKTKDELLDDSKFRYSDKIDGYTGATAEEIKSVTVEGALYSTYSLWNLVNGDIRQVLRKHTLDHINQRFLDQLINSDNPMTVLTGLKSFQKKDYADNFQLIVTVLKRGNAMVNFYIAKNIPEEMLDSGKYKDAILAIWDLLDPNTKFILTKKIN